MADVVGHPCDKLADSPQDAEQIRDATTHAMATGEQVRYWLKAAGHTWRIIVDRIPFGAIVLSRLMPPAARHLPPGDRELLRTLADGHDQGAIARAVGLSQSAVSRRLAMLRRLLGVETDGGLIDVWRAME
jgi:DNA-binding NarL/FixJ family response regulator